MIEIRELYKKYSDKGKEVIALDNVNLHFDDKGFVFVLGKSGSGKTTLLNLIGGLDRTNKGNIFVDFLKNEKENMDILKSSENEMEIYHNLHLGFIFQDYHLIDNMTVRENILITMQQQVYGGQHKEDYDKKISEILEYVGLEEEITQRRICELSGGQAQRVSIARALIKEPKLILADEPTGNLDSQNGKKVFELLKKISKNRLVVIVTHDENAAWTYGDRIIRISDGKVIEDKWNTPEKEEYKIRIINQKNNNKEFEYNGSKKNICEYLYNYFFQFEEKCKTILVEIKKVSLDNISKERLEEGSNKSINKIPFVEILRFSIRNILKNKIKFVITTIALAIVILFAEVLGEICISSLSKPICNYIIQNKEYIYLKTDLKYEDKFGEEHSVTTGRTNSIESVLKKNCVDEEIIKCNSEVSIQYKEQSISVMLNTNLIKDENLVGKTIQNNDEICITDYVAYLLGVKKGDIGKELELFQTKFKLCGIINTDYKETDIINKMKRGVLNEVEEDKLRYEYLICICAKDYNSHVFEHSKNLDLLSADFTTDRIDAYTNSRVCYSDISRLDGKGGLMYGRYPKKQNEVLISYDFAIDNHLIDGNRFIEKEYSYMDIYNEKYNSSYENVFNIYDIIQTIKVVGIVDVERPIIDVWMPSKMFYKIKDVYCRDYLYNLYQIKVSNKSKEKLMAFVRDIYSNNIYVDEENILKIQGIYEYKDNLEYIGWGLTLIFTTLVVLLIFSFLTYNVSDSQKTVGILRALGVNKRVIVKIFVLEAIYMTCSAFFIQFIGSFGVVKYINLFLCSNLQVHLKFFGREIKMIGIIFMFTVVVGVISVVSPVLSMFKKEIIKLIKG